MADATPTTQLTQNGSATTARLDKPNRDEVDKKAKELDATIKANLAIIAEVAEKLEKLSKKKESGEDKRSLEFKKLTDLRAESKRLTEQRNALYDEQKRQRDNLTKLRATQEEMRTRLKQNNCFSTESVEAKIRELEYRLATTSLSLKEEKVVIQDIKNLNLSKKTIADFDAIGKRRQELEAKIKDVDANIQKIKDAVAEARTKEKAQSDLVDGLKKPAGKSEGTILYEKRQAASAEIQAARQKVKELWSEYREKQEAFNKALTARRQEQQEKRKADFEKRKEEDRIRKLEGEEEKIERLHVEAFASIEQLKIYLKAQLKSQAEAEDDAKPAAPVALQEGQIGKRVTGFDEDIFGTRKAPKKAKSRKPRKARPMVFDAQSLVEFESLKIEPPLTTDEIPAALEALDKKKADLEADKAAQHKKRLANLAAALESKDAKEAAAAATAAEQDPEETPAADPPAEAEAEPAAFAEDERDQAIEAAEDDGVIA